MFIFHLKKARKLAAKIRSCSHGVVRLVEHNDDLDVGVFLGQRRGPLVLTPQHSVQPQKNLKQS
jgi:hypothetical protein